MHKFFVPAENIIDEKAIIDGDDVKHIYKVLRLECGDAININNCQGKEYKGEIESIDKKSVVVKILEQVEVNNENPLNIYLYQGLPKSTKMDLIVQKSTELGIKEIIPIITERVEVKASLKEFKKLDRWNRIALEACKQCKRSLIPSVTEPLKFNDLLEEIKGMDLIVVPYESKENYGIKSLIKNIEYEKENIKNIGIIIGPEGGFEESEIRALEEIKAQIVTLGPRIFRTETAGIVCASIISYELGDLGGNI
ncbi:16S rRNA (uracil(1498)-N(3))-methyltransferase [Clostridium botulinum]|uniref:16S rRNA (uracil(1498)-N(3))-methyltransferase n=1 Tax=Clostridium botulinum TaxID=1491 RepID=UPI000A1746A1|nr:16S rRNA (uracil(1498)-N(3))-methyltransferase [Clostridium botulinum]AUN18804.1 16S rRNA (uracil(1498)-N(3))-methyltransferase [Clostridium botulinum]MCC5422419.1 16S rRNA (uracil(1498)-N(3))-methyltransferase [Clostridium botulinum]OSA86182.1 16S rRNA (uracil(1498)-N(3))-methyltransferase [Clostridium botulinum]HDI3056462.1 16S rRNA (uracil(1498)-N(3))-methyltransferase [Clostridium botulinum]